LTARASLTADDLDMAQRALTQVLGKLAAARS
jgi:hypothetical protein